MIIQGICIDAARTVPAEFYIRKDGVITTIWSGTTWKKLPEASALKVKEYVKTYGKRILCRDRIFWKEIFKTSTATPTRITNKQMRGAPMSSWKIDPFFTDSETGVQVDDQPRKETPVEPAWKTDVQVVSEFVKFFKDFEFTPQVRLMNSLGNCKNEDEVREYVHGYFQLTNNSYKNDVDEKMKSAEFKEMAKSVIGRSGRKINRRFEVYFGEPGSGKTTKAINDNPKAKVVVCHAGMTPDELFRGFDFQDGKPTFKSCPMKDAMKNGEVIILDEINLLNEDCRRTLQAILDEKSEVVVNAETIEIKDGFKVVGTMNLVVNEMCFPLPAPLVDRAEVIREFSMPAEKIAELAF